MSAPLVLELLRLHVPLTLLCDLADPAGPASREIARREAANGSVAAASVTGAPLRAAIGA